MKPTKKQEASKPKKYQKPAIEMHGKITDMVLTIESDGPSPLIPTEQ